MNDINKWIQIRKNLFKKAQEEVRFRLGEDSPAFQLYEAEYLKEFRRWQIASKAELFEAIAGARVLMLADFHALHQSQRAQLRILRNLPSDRPTYLAVEFLFAEDQQQIDAYMLGEISEEVFLERVHWHQRWGFPFENYRVLLDWARNRNIIVRGINQFSDSTAVESLHQRDQFAAECLVELLAVESHSLVVVVYGDLHLATAHIPSCLQEVWGESLSLVRVFQNVESIYFEVAKQDMDLKTELVRVGEGSYCLLNIPPWVKWQSYLMYLDRTTELMLSGDDVEFEDGDFDDEDDDDDDDDDFEEASFDVADQVAEFVRLIAFDLEVDVELGRLSVETAFEAGDSLIEKTQHAAAVLDWIHTLKKQEVSFYVPEIQAGYLARLSVNHAAALAYQYVAFYIKGEGFFITPSSKEFLRQILREGLIYFGTKLVNPKRKSETVQDLQMALLAQDQKGAVSVAMKLALAQKFHETMQVRGIQGTPLHQSMDAGAWEYYLASRFLGGMLGEKLYMAFRQQIASVPEIVRWSAGAFINPGDIQELYFEVLKKVDGIVLPFVSKEEVL